MKVSLNWLKELVDHQLSSDELASKLSLNSIGVKQQTEDYLELDLTYNRGDLLSLRGVAYEVSAITDSPLRFLSQIPEDFIWVGQNLPKVNVKVENEHLSPIYCVAKIENLKVGKSNEAWVKKLSDSGIRSISNIADVTNLIMVQYGQPMHAFDADKVKDESLVVRTAKKGEEEVTLDGKKRDLDPFDLLIADSEKVLGLAGVMGGKDSEVSDSTTSILLEAAIFDPVAIRKTAKRLGLYSEASKRFLHGLSPIRLLQALDAAIRLYQSLGGKLTALSLVGNLDDELKTVKLTQQKLNSLLGVDVLPEVVESSLTSLGFNLRGSGIDWEVTIPYWRLDIEIEEDLIEEVARMYGYEKIEGVTLPDEKIPKLDQALPDFIYSLKTKLKEIGLTEIQTYSFYSTAVLEALGIAEEGKKNLIKIANPISSETEYLRDQLWPNLLEVVGKNIKKGYQDIGIFEIGKAYCKDDDGRIKETDRLSIALMNGTENPLEELIVILNEMKNISFAKALDDRKREASHLFHPNRQVAEAAEVHLRVLNKLGIEKRVAVLEIEVSDLV